MKNKIFSNRHSASYYFKKISYNFVAFLIHQPDSDVYIVCNQDTYDSYMNECELKYDLLRMSY